MEIKVLDRLFEWLLHSDTADGLWGSVTWIKFKKKKTKLSLSVIAGAA